MLPQCKPINFAKVQGQMMVNLELMKMASETMMSMRFEWTCLMLQNWFGKEWKQIWSLLKQKNSLPMQGESRLRTLLMMIFLASQEGNFQMLVSLIHRNKKNFKTFWSISSSYLWNSFDWENKKSILFGQKTPATTATQWVTRIVTLTVHHSCNHLCLPSYGLPTSRTIHISPMAYNNTLFFGEFVQSDWDMFHSLHLAVESHGATWAIVECAIYVSDEPGNLNFELLSKLVLPDEPVLHAQLSSRSTRDLPLC